jgi:putative membrane protein
MTCDNRIASWMPALVGLMAASVMACSDDQPAAPSALQVGAQVVEGADAGEDDAGPSDIDAGDIDAGDVDAGEVVLSDGEIAAIVSAVNAGEIEQAEFALLRSSVAEVRAYAHTMIDDHTAANEALAATLASIMAEPDANSISRELTAQGAEVLLRLQRTPSPEFELFYIARQAEQHAQVLSLLDTLLLPEVENAELATLLGSIRTSVAAHLAAAEAILENPPVIEPAPAGAPAPAPAE